MNRGNWVSFLGITFLAIGGLVYTFVAGNEPVLGIQLQGGASVVLTPTEDPPEGALEDAIEIIRARIDTLGVAEPEISRQGNNILVEVPGVEDQQQAIDLIQSVAKLEFRPVLASIDEISYLLQSGQPLPTVPTTSGADGSTTSTTSASTTSAAPTTTTSATTTASVPEETAGATTTAAPGDTAAPGETVPEESPTTTVDLDALQQEFADQWELTDPSDATNDGNVVYAEYVGEGDDRQISRRHLLGPLQLDGTAVSDADARNPGFQGWVVELELDPASSLDPLASQCFNGAPTCPRTDAETGRLGIVLDGQVEFAGTVGSPTFDGTVVLSGNYNEDTAKEMAIVLRVGALPIEFQEPTTQQVSATIGRSALDAGITAGIVGLALVSLFIVGYYRVLGLVALASLGVSGAMLWTIVAWLGTNKGLTLTLAGITGLIVSIGVSVDSNIVYFEHLREDVRNGRTPRSAVDRAFPVAFATIVNADMASLIGAVLLYFLTTGAVRGFAFYLGLSVILDLVATYFFMRPAVRLITRSPSFDEAPDKWGVPSGRRKGATA